MTTNLGKSIAFPSNAPGAREGKGDSNWEHKFITATELRRSVHRDVLHNTTHTLVFECELAVKSKINYVMVETKMRMETTDKITSLL